MTYFDAFIRLTEALAKLLAVLVWPAVAAFFLVRFGPSIKKFINRVSEVDIKGGGFEASIKHKQAEAAAALAAAGASRPDGDADRGRLADPRAAATIVAEVAPPRVIRRVSGSNVLWVDDHPNNNIYPRQALEALGVDVQLAKSTNEALERLGAHRFDAIISDMGRPPDARAGYTLLDKLRSQGNKTPFIIYAGSRSPEDQAESRRHGAIGCTNQPDELLEMVLGALSDGA